MKTTYTLFTTVSAIEEKFIQKHISGAGKDAVFQQVSDGWFALLDGFNDWIFLDVLPPLTDELTTGDKVAITIQKVI